MSTRLSQRLVRLLNLVPYFQENPGISAAAAAAELGVTTGQLMSDLNQLWMCGLPGYGPGDLIDLSFSEDSITVTFNAGIDRPLRLTGTEATATLVALRSLIDLPGTVDPGAAQRAIAKIEQAAGTVRGLEAIAEIEGTESEAVRTVRGAVAARRAIRLRYYSASRDAVSDRVVDPLDIVVVDDHTYLRAWCRSAEGVRLFRFDRIETAERLEEPARPPADTPGSEDSLELFRDDPALPLARLEVAGNLTWVLDHYPMTPTGREVDDGSGRFEVTMRYATQDWMVRLILGFGGGITVVEPESLRDAVDRRAGDALAAYAAWDD